MYGEYSSGGVGEHHPLESISSEITYRVLVLKPDFVNKKEKINRS